MLVPTRSGIKEACRYLMLTWLFSMCQNAIDNYISKTKNVYKTCIWSHSSTFAR